MQFQESASIGRNDALSISEAKAWFDNIPSVSLRTNSDTEKHLQIHTPFWNRAIQAADSNYSIVELPVQFDISPGIMISDSSYQKGQPEKANDVVRLLILKDKKDGTMRSALMHIVSENGIADSSNTYNNRNNHFSGFILFTNLDGSFINGWKYENGKITKSSSKKRKAEMIKKRMNMGEALSLMAPPEPEPVSCTTTIVDWYERFCTEYTNGAVSCTPWNYLYSETYTFCTGGSGSGGGGGGGGGGGSVQNGYIEKDGKENDLPFLDDRITPDTSISNNPVIKCIYDNLTNPNLQYGITSILSAFLGNEFNVTFQLLDLPNNVEGRTHLDDDNKNFTIYINKDRALDADYSRTYIASTFIHEAFHAKLRQHAIEALGTDEISKWPKKIDDMTLRELMDYYELTSKKGDQWESIGHDWMAKNIDSLAISIRSYIQTYYKQTASIAGSELSTYEALAYMGLQNSHFYTEEVIDKGREDQFNHDRGILNAIGCSN